LEGHVAVFEAAWFPNLVENGTLLAVIEDKSGGKTHN